MGVLLVLLGDVLLAVHYYRAGGMIRTSMWSVGAVALVMCGNALDHHRVIALILAVILGVAAWDWSRTHTVETTWKKREKNR